MKQMIRTLIVIFFLVQAVHSLEYCQDFEIQVSGSVIVEGGMANHKGQNFRILYDIETDESETKKLKAYKTNQVLDSDQILIQIDIQEFETAAQAMDEIVYVSPSGDCIVIDEGTSLTAYTTSSGSFVQVQNVSVETYTSIQASQNCNVIEIITEESDNQIYVGGEQIVSDNMPDSQTVFEETFRFGVNGNGNAYEYSADTEEFTVSNADGLLSEVLEVKMRDDEIAVLVLSKNEEGMYTIDVFDTSSTESLFTNMFSRTWDSSEISGTPVLATHSGMKTAMLRDENGLLSFLRIRNVNGKPSIINVQLENSDQNSALTDVNMVSLGRNFLVTYGQESINYFQIQSMDDLVYLGSYSFNLIAERTKLTSSLTDEHVVYIIMEPIVTDACDVDLTEDEQDELDDDTVEDVTDDDGDTLVCPPACISCNKNSHCTRCSPGYVTKNGLCVKCDGCKRCNANKPSQCFQCFGHQTFVSQTKTCIDTEQCPGTCLRCDTDANCLECPEYYYLINNACALCEIDGCINCDSDPFACDVEECGDSFIYVSNNCVECTTGCLKCSQADLSNCTECVPGFYAIIDQTQNPIATTCEPCLQNCQTCSDATTCTTCFEGFKTNADQTVCILQCDPSCLTCPENQPTKCLSCRYSYELDSDAQTCTASVACNASATCKSCPSNYAIEENQCFECQTSDPNCAGCAFSNLTQCLSCKASYFLAEDNTCSSCSAACSSCLDQTLCFSCDDQFYLLKMQKSSLDQGYCFACQSPCKTCFSAEDICRSCVDGYTLRNRKCLSSVRNDWSVTIIIENTIFVLISESLFNKIKAAIESRIPSISFGKRSFFMDTIEDGSTIVGGTISTTSEQQATFQEGIAEALTPGTSVDGYMIESSTVVSTSELTTDEGTVEGESESESSSDIIWILAVCIPLGILLIGGIFWMVIRVRRRKEELGKSDDLGQSAKTFTIDEYEETDKI